MHDEQFAGTAFSYIRFSSLEQEQGDSIRRQRELRDGWLQRNQAVTLDTTLSGEDRGVSAFRGANRSDKHYLGRFLEAVRRGLVPVGSILLLESLDRLSRQEEEEALALLLGLLNSGIIIVQLEPYTVFRKGDGMMGLMRALIVLSRAREESATKSSRVSKAWRNKQHLAGESKKIITARCPAWLEVVDGRFRFKAGALAVVKRIYKRCIEGHGARMIAHDLHRDDVPHFEDGGRWQSTYVTAILRNPAVIGRCQPMHRVNGKRVPNGSPVEGYFPRAVTDREFYAAQKTVGARKYRGGRRGTDGWVALFSPVFDARSGERMQAIGRVAEGRRYRVLQPAGVLRWQTKCVSFPLDSFEGAILSRLVELDVNDVAPPTEDGGKVSDAAAVLAELESRISRIQAAMVEGEDADSTMPVLRELDKRRKAAAAELAAAQAAKASPAHEQFGTLRGLVKAVATDKDARIRVRAATGRLIERIDVLIFAASDRRAMIAQVRFRQTSAVRTYLIRHFNSKGGKVPARWDTEDVKWDSPVAATRKLPTTYAELAEQIRGALDAGTKNRLNLLDKTDVKLLDEMARAAFPA